MTASPRDRRILRAAMTGLPPALLARRFRTTPNAISAALSRLRRCGYEVPPFPTSTRVPATAVPVRQEVLKTMAAAAKRAGMSTRDATHVLIRWAVESGQLADILKRGGRA